MTMEPLLPNICDFIAHVSPLNTLPVEAQNEIARSISISYLAVGETLPFDIAAVERYLYIVRTGSLEQRWSDGVLRARLGPEDLFGFTFLEGIPGNPEDCYNVTAIENTLLYQIPHSVLKSMLQKYPQYATHFSINAHERLNCAMDVVWSDEDKGMFVRKVADLASNTISVVDARTSIQETARQMRWVDRCSTAVIMDDDKIIGIISDRDMTRRVVAEGFDISRPVRDVMTAAPITVSSGDLVMHAVALMMRHGVSSLPVVDCEKPVGLLTASHLVQHHRVQAIFLIERINHCQSVDELAVLKVERQAIFEALVEGNLRSGVVEMVMSMLMDAFTRRLIELALSEFGEPPCEFSWIVAGSHSRNEVHVHSDQDSAIILPDSAGIEEQMWFLRFARFVCLGLDECGYPLCTGHFMASESRWCQPLSVWQACIRKWVTNPEYTQLLNATVFLETRAFYGNTWLHDAFQQSLLNDIAAHPGFLRSLTRDSANTSPPLGIFNNLVLEKSGNDSKTLNIKRFALTLIIDLSRIYALAAGSSETNTEARFRAARDKGLMSPGGCTDIIDAFHFLTRLRFNHQLSQLRKGITPDNQIDPREFGSFERKHLKDAFRIIARQQELARMLFVKG
ncbi:putative nucleotidyltransferase substrate binding domain-containing protein [Buttiauxella gaviniae]|uniref:putative nucleotidyltransferase substrate binding domain-containing protein n=1 Tax=Buttiauxella gaviniae TaxID=82990 RepID=UPI003C75FD43